MKHKFLSLLVAGLVGTTLSLTTTGCAVKSAMDQPEKKDTSVFKRGTPRFEVIGEIGKPVDTEINEDGTIIDTYSFIQGYSKGVKAARALGHAVLDVYTLGLWEVVGSPAETIANGEKIVVRVKYDKDKTVDKVTVLKGKGEIVVTY